MENYDKLQIATGSIVKLQKIAETLSSLTCRNIAVLCCTRKYSELQWHLHTHTHTHNTTQHKPDDGHVSWVVLANTPFVLVKYPPCIYRGNTSKHAHTIESARVAYPWTNDNKLWCHSTGRQRSSCKNLQSNREEAWIKILKHTSDFVVLYCVPYAMISQRIVVLLW